MNDMASRKSTPPTSRIARPRPVVAYARRQKGDGDDQPAAADAVVAATAKPTVPSAEPDTTTGIVTPDDLKRQIEKIPLKPEKPAPEKPPESQRARTETMIALAPVAHDPPAMPTEAPPIDVSMGGVEDPTNLPGPREIPGGHPQDPASAPGRVPSGDSRSLRREAEFALVYRQGTIVITRVGTVGTRGVWRVVEYPTSSSASHSYAKECSRCVSEGFSDYRD